MNASTRGWLRPAGCPVAANRPRVPFARIAAIRLEPFGAYAGAGPAGESGSLKEGWMEESDHYTDIVSIADKRISS